MTVNVGTFKSAFPEFANNTDSQVNFWLTQGVATLSARLLGTRYDLAVMLFAAHNLFFSMRNQRTAQAGGVPGQVTGPVQSMSVGPVSKTMSGVQTLANSRAGQYAYTTYGQQLWALIQASVAGGIYLPGRPPVSSGYPANGYLGAPGYGRVR